MENAVSLVEHQHLTEMNETLRRKLQESTTKEIGGSTSGLRSTVLSLVVSESYPRAKDELAEYVDRKVNFPGFQERSQRYVQHGSELVQAIQTKRGFPGLATLSLAKQQEIHEKVLEHFEELKHVLKQIEKIEREHRLNDIRSTVWVIRSAVVTVFAILAAYFMMDVESGLFTTAIKVVDVAINDASTWLVNLIDL